MILETDSLSLRPLVPSDAPDVATQIFSDPLVAGTLMHNTHHPADAMREAEQWTKWSGACWDAGSPGLFAVTRRLLPDQLIGVAGFYTEKDTRKLWNGEYFYALGATHHRQGLMREVAEAIKPLLTDWNDLGRLYAVYWDMINDASGRVLHRSGFRPSGRKLLTEEYDTERCLAVHNYDCWRLATAPREQRADIAVLAARRAGALVSECILDRAEAIHALEDAACAPLPIEAISMLEAAIQRPGMAQMEFTGQMHNRGRLASRVDALA